MVHCCSAVNCKNRYEKGKNRSFFKFPLKDKLLTKKWVIAMKRDKWTPTKHSSLCSDHFTESNFRYNNNLRYLLPGVVPSVFQFPDHLMKKKVESRLPPKKRRLMVSDEVSNKDVEKEEIQPRVLMVSITKDHGGYTLPVEVKKLYLEQREECQKLRRTLHTVKQDANRQRQKCTHYKEVILDLKRKLFETRALFRGSDSNKVLTLETASIDLLNKSTSSSGSEELCDISD